MPQFAENIKRKYKNVRKSHKFLSIFITFLLVLISFFLIFNISDIFSSLITHKKGLFFVDRIEVTSYNIYGVSSKDFESEEDANNYASTIINQGAMGEVYHHGEYFVLVATYPTLLEAQEVQNNLINLGYNARIVNIFVKEFKHDYRGSDKALIEQSLYKFREIYYSLYNIDIDFDKGNLSRSSFTGKVAQILTEITAFCSRVSSSQISKEIKENLTNSFSSVIDLLEEVLYSPYSNFETSSLLKRNMFQIVQINEELAYNM